MTERRERKLRVSELEQPTKPAARDEVSHGPA